MKKESRGSEWTERRKTLEVMLADGLTPKQIAERLGKTQSAIHEWIRRFKIPLKLKRRPKHQPACPRDKPPPPAIEPMVGTVYIDENGLKVTRYPARYAFGALMQSSIVRSTR